MNPSKLPPLSAATEAKVKEHRRYWKGKAKLSIVRKGQTDGHVCISATEADKTRRMWYGPDGQLVRMVIERPLFTLAAKPATPESALMLNTMEDAKWQSQSPPKATSSSKGASTTA